MTLKSVHFHLLLLHQVELYKHVANLKVDMILITEIVTLKFGSKPNYYRLHGWKRKFMTYLSSLVSLQLKYFSVFRMFNNCAVTSKLFLSLAHDFLQIDIAIDKLTAQKCEM